MEENKNIPNEENLVENSENIVKTNTDGTTVEKQSNQEDSKKSDKLVIEKVEKSNKKSDKKKVEKTKKPSKTKKVAKDTLNEIKKVTWPSFKTVLKQTGIVLAVVVVFALVIFGFDRVLSLGYNALIRLVSGS